MSVPRGQGSASEFHSPLPGTPCSHRDTFAMDGCQIIVAGGGILVIAPLADVPPEGTPLWK